MRNYECKWKCNKYDTYPEKNPLGHRNQKIAERTDPGKVKYRGQRDGPAGASLLSRDRRAPDRHDLRTRAGDPEIVVIDQ